MRDEKYAEIKHMTTITTAKAERMGASICPGCWEKIPQAGWLLNIRNLYFTILEAGKSKDKADAESGEDPVSGSQLMIPLYCVFPL